MWLDRDESADGELFAESPRTEFVPVMFARDRADAEWYRGLLETAGIPALVECCGGETELRLAVGGSVPLRVPEHLHDGASEMVAAAEKELLADFDDDLEDDEDDDEVDDDEDDLDEADGDDLA
jgi:hypothetical protein